MTAKMKTWFANNNIRYDSVSMEKGQAIFIKVDDRKAVFEYLKKIKRFKEWEYRSNYEYILIYI
jgi:glutaredoxin-related protein